MNKYLGLAISLASSVALAMPSNNAAIGPFFGPYIGAGAGYASQNANYVYDQINYNNTFFSNSFTAKNSSAAYRFLAGYGLTLYPIYLGSELSFGDITGENKTIRLDSAGNSLINEQQKKDIMASFLVGVPITETTLAYVQIGIGGGQYELSITDANTTVIPQRQQQTNWTFEKSAGLGIEQKVYENLSLRLSYLYEKAERINGPTATTFNFAKDTLYNVHMHTYEITNQIAMLDFIWRMDCA